MFGESFLGLYVLGIFALFLLLDTRWQLKRFHRFEKILFFIWISFLVSTFFSSIFTKSTPLTVSAWPPLLLVLPSYVWTVSRFQPKSDFKSTTFFNAFLFEYIFPLILVTFSLLFLSFIFLVRPEWGASLPPMNLVFSSFGHNHIAAVLILIIPLAWWLLLLATTNKKIDKTSRFIAFLLPIAMYIGLFFSFGRVAIGIVTLQSLCAFYFFRKYSKYNPRLSLGKFRLRLQHIFFGVIGSISLVFGVLIFLSLATGAGDQFTCSSPFFRFKVCKPVINESRFDYWKQAITSLSDFPLTGYGPGTFSLISERYKFDQNNGTSFAHNIVLKVAAESGLVAGFLFFLTVVLLIRNIFSSTLLKTTSSKHDIKSLYPFLFLSIIGSVVNALLDFDWNFFGILFMTVSFAAVASRLAPAAKQKTRHAPKPFTAFVVFTRLNIVVVIFFSLFYLVAETFILLGKEGLTAKYVPFFQPHMKILLAADLEQANKDRIKTLYSAHRERYLDSILNGNEDSFTLDDLQTWRIVDPWNTDYSLELIEQFIDTGRYELAAFELKHYYQQQVVWSSRLDTPDLDFVDRRKFGLFTKQIGDWYFSTQQYDLAAQYYVMAYQSFRWEMAEHSVPYSFPLDDKLLDSNYFLYLTEIPLQFFSSSQYTHAKAYSQWLEAQVKSGTSHSVSPDVIRTIDLIDQKSEFTSKLIFGVLEDFSSLKTTSQDDMYRHKQQAKLVTEIEMYRVTIDGQSGTSGEFLAFLVEYGNFLMSQGDGDAQFFYDAALSFSKNALYEHSYWPELHDPESASTQSLQVFTDAFHGKKEEQIGWKTEVVAAAFFEYGFRLARQMQRNEALLQWEDYVSYFPEPERKSRLLNPLYVKFASLLKSDDTEGFEQLCGREIPQLLESMEGTPVTPAHYFEFVMDVQNYVRSSDYSLNSQDKIQTCVDLLSQ